MNKKLIILAGGILFFLISILVFSYLFYKDVYKSCECVVESMDEYGYAITDKGIVLAFRGSYSCEDGSSYYYWTLNELVGKRLYAEYKITDDGDLKVEKFYINGKECVKGKGGYNYES